MALQILIQLRALETPLTLIIEVQYVIGPAKIDHLSTKITNFHHLCSVIT